MVIKTKIMKTKHDIEERIMGIKYMKKITLERIGKRHCEYDKTQNGFDVEIKTLEWVLNKS